MQDKKALSIFESAYPLVSRQRKEQILHGIGQIGDPSSIAFLVKVLNEPFESIRLSAARALLLCLNH
jgi:HEAT repeat protein